MNTNFHFREATIVDIPQIQIVRNAVKENRLSNPDLVTDEACAEYITLRGKGWVCQLDERIVGFAIADLIDHNIWALFIHPEYECNGIGKKLHNMMLHWYFENTDHPVWLSTAANTRAEKFYTNRGWTKIGTLPNGEIKFQKSNGNVEK
jgi:GNAT superfamily N-acetyltransferase